MKASYFYPALFAAVAVLICVNVHDERNIQAEVGTLHPRVQEAISNYVENMDWLQVGDFVTVRNWDDLNSSRTLVVGEKLPHGVFLVKDPGPNSSGLTETIRFDPGIEAGRKMTSKYALSFICQNHPGHSQIANWYWLQ